jgi:hypothetical protein
MAGLELLNTSSTDQSMPVSNKASPSRYSIEEPIADDDLELIRCDPGARTVQTSGSLAPDTWRRIDSGLLARRPELELRAFGFYPQTCNLSFLNFLPHARNLTLDCIHGRVEELDRLRGLGELDSLCIGMWELDDFDFLRDVSTNLRSLSLHQTKSKKPDLALLERFSKLQTLFIEGHKKSLDVISTLPELEGLTLRSVTVPGLAFLRACPKLWSVDLKLGGIRDLSGLSGLKLKYLELWQTRGLADISVISEILTLQNLFLQSLPKVTALPPMDRLGCLRRLVLDNMSGLKSFEPILHATALEEFALYTATKSRPDDLSAILGKPRLKRVSAGFGSKNRNDLFERMRDAAGLEAFNSYSEFLYQ